MYVRMNVLKVGETNHGKINGNGSDMSLAREGERQMKKLFGVFLVIAMVIGIAHVCAPAWRLKVFSYAKIGNHPKRQTVKWNFAKSTV